MANLIIDTAGDNIFFKIISEDIEYNIKHENSRENFDTLVELIFNFINENNIELSKIDNIFVNQGPGKYSSIRSAISIVKALKITKNINIYGYYSTQISNNDYNILLKLLKEGRLTKKLIQPKYLN
tara:strand:+ start:4376 stop:4753 length:378 start_codon:yes stop_codon:yes gene_type:complete